MRSRFFAVPFFLALVASTNAQLAPANNPVVDAIGRIGSTGLKDSSKPAKSPTLFKASGKREFLDNYLAAAYETQELRDGVKPVFEKLFESFDTTAKTAGFANDASGAVAFSVALLHSLATKSELDDQAFMVLIDKLQTTLDVPTVRNATDKQKQEAYEWAICTAGSVVVAANGAKTESDLEKIQTLSAISIKALIGGNLDQITFKGKDVSVKPLKVEKQPIGDNGGGGLAPGFSLSVPEGWVKDTKSSWYVSRYRDPKHGNNADTVSALVRFLPAVPAKGSFSDALRKAWKEGVPPELADKGSNMVFRRYVGDSLFSQFIYGKGLEKGRESQSLFSVYLIDCGAMWQPVVIAQIWDSAYPNAVGADMSAGFSYGTSANMAEQILATFKCASGKGKPIVEKKDLAGEYNFGNYASMDYVNIYSGATSTSYVSYGGTLSLASNGSFIYNYSSASSNGGLAKFAGVKGAGKWTIDGDVLTTAYSQYDQGDSYKVKEHKYRIAGLVVFPDGEKVAVLIQDLKKPINAVTVGDRSEFYTTKKK